MQPSQQPLFSSSALQSSPSSSPTSSNTTVSVEEEGIPKTPSIPANRSRLIAQLEEDLLYLASQQEKLRTLIAEQMESIVIDPAMAAKEAGVPVQQPAQQQMANPMEAGAYEQARVQQSIQEDIPRYSSEFPQQHRLPIVGEAQQEQPKEQQSLLGLQGTSTETALKTMMQEMKLPSEQEQLPQQQAQPHFISEQYKQELGAQSEAPFGSKIPIVNLPQEQKHFQQQSEQQQPTGGIAAAPPTPTTGIPIVKHEIGQQYQQQAAPHEFEVVPEASKTQQEQSFAQQATEPHTAFNDIFFIVQGCNSWDKVCECHTWVCANLLKTPASNPSLAFIAEVGTPAEDTVKRLHQDAIAHQASAHKPQGPREKEQAINAYRAQLNKNGLWEGVLSKNDALIVFIDETGVEKSEELKEALKSAKGPVLCF